MNISDHERLHTEDAIRAALTQVLARTVYPQMFLQVLREVLAKVTTQTGDERSEVDQKWVNPFDSSEPPPRSPKFRDFDGSF